jgi:hypothetical protein
MMVNFKKRTHNFSTCNNRARHWIWSKASVPFGGFYETFVTSILLHSIHNGRPSLVVCLIMFIQYCHLVVMRSCYFVTKRNKLWSRCLFFENLFHNNTNSCPLLVLMPIGTDWFRIRSAFAICWLKALLCWIQVDSAWECLLVGLVAALLYMWQLW